MKYKSAMSFKMRNNLILFMFVVMILIVGGFYILYSYPKKLDQLKTELDGVEKQISEFDGIENQFIRLQALIADEELKLANLDKQILPNVSSSNTYAYLNSISERSGQLPYDFIYSDNGTSGKYGFNAYHIKGEGSFEDIYKFIWYIERGPQIYKFKNVSLRGVESSQRRSRRSNIIITFDLELCALFADVHDLPIIQRDLDSVVVDKFNDPFNPRVKRILPPNRGDYIEVERSELKAVIPGKAFIADHHGKVRVIQVGDKVYLGYATKIDLEKNQVEFTLNKNGKVQKFLLRLRFKN